MLTILGYHHVSHKERELESDKLYISPDSFVNQLKILNEKNYKTKQLSELILLNEDIDNNLYATLTFDDGYKDFYLNAYPSILKYNFKATLFVIVDKIGQPEYCDLNMLREMQKFGIEIGSHTMSHPTLTKLEKKELIYEISHSKEVLEDLLNKEIKSFCYPYGKYNSEIVEIVESSGYEVAVTTNTGINNLPLINKYELNRVAAEYPDDAQSLSYKLVHGRYKGVGE